VADFYTYLIGWSSLDKWYYGSQYNKKANPKDLWVKYFTSSKYVKKFVEENGDPDIIEVRKIFSTAKDVRNYEHKILKKLKVIKKEKWLNKTDNISIAPECANPGRKLSEEHKKKISESNKGRPGIWLGCKFSEETKKKMSLVDKSYMKTEEYRQKMSNAKKGLRL
jgi:NUMOD3 motif